LLIGILFDGVGCFCIIIFCEFFKLISLCSLPFIAYCFDNARKLY
jgi:hypothetical protein